MIGVRASLRIGRRMLIFAVRRPENCVSPVRGDASGFATAAPGAAWRL
jgi:hypothetical protein